MERPTGMRNRLVALSAVLAFAVGVAAVAVVAGSGGGGEGRLEKLSFAFAGGERSSMALGAPAAYPQFGPLEYKVRGDLPEFGGEVPAYRLGDETSKGEVSELASRLGLEGDVEASANGWTVRDDERELSVLRAPGVPWYLSRTCAEAPALPTAPTSSAPSDGVVSSSGCAYGGVSMAGGGSSASSPALPTAEPRRTAIAPVPAPPPTTMPPERPADHPTKAEAERLARSFFTDLGIGFDGFQLRDGFVEWHAVVEPRIGELPAVGWAHSVALGPKARIMTANGFLAEPDRIGAYPLAGTTKALDRLRAGEGTGPRPLGGAMDGGSATVGPGCAEATEICYPPVPVTTIPGSDPPRSTTTTMAIQPPTSAIAEPANQAPTPMTTLACPPTGGCSIPPDAGPPPPPANAPAGATSPPPPHAPAPSPPLRPPVLTITGVHLALQHVGAALVPVYVFELEGGGETMPVPAVTDEWIEENRQGAPDVGPGGDRPVPPAPMPMPVPAPMSSVVTTVPVPPAGAEPGRVPTEVEGVPAARP